MLDEKVELLLNKEENRGLLEGLEQASRRVKMAKRELAEIEKQEIEAKSMRDYVTQLELRASEAGSGIGGFLSAVHGFSTGIPYIQNRVKGPKWLPFVIGLPPLLMFSAASAAFGGYALPRFAQLSVTSYYAASSASHYGVSLLTRHIEDNHASRIQQKGA